MNKQSAMGVAAAMGVCVVASAQPVSITDVNATGVSETVVVGTDGSFDQVFFTGGFSADGVSASGGTDSGIVTAIAEARSETSLTASVTQGRSGIARIDFEISAMAMINLLEPGLVDFASTSASIGGTDTLIVIDIFEDVEYSWSTELIVAGDNGGEVSLSLLGRPDEGTLLAGEPLLVNFGFGISASTLSGNLFNEAVLRGTLLLPAPGAVAVMGAAGVWASRRRRG